MTVKTELRENRTINIDAEEYSDIIDELFSKELDILVIEGGLTNEYVVVNDSNITLNGVNRKYMIFYTTYANCWSCNVYCLLTDNDDVYNEWYEKWYKALYEEGL